MQQPKSAHPPVQVEIFTAGSNTDTAVVGSPILLSAIVLRAGAPDLTSTSTEQDFVPFIVTVQGYNACLILLLLPFSLVVSSVLASS